MARANINMSLVVAGVSAQVNQSRTDDGYAGLTPSTIPVANAGTLSTRTSASVGVVTTSLTPGVVQGDRAILVWVDSTTNSLKCRYDVLVGAVSGLNVPISSDSNTGGNDLPTSVQATALTIAKQVEQDIHSSFDELDTFLVTTNVAGVVVLRDVSNATLITACMSANGVALWLKDSGFTNPAAGGVCTHALFGSGDTSATGFYPNVVALFDPTLTASG